MKYFKIAPLIFFIIISSITAFFGTTALMKLYHYYRLKVPTAAKIKSWEIIELRNGKCVVAARYQFEVDGQLLSGKTKLDNKKFLNYYAAAEHLKKWAKKSWTSWYDPNNVKFSSLQKRFPLNAVMKSLISLIVLIYFIGLKKFSYNPDIL